MAARKYNLLAILTIISVSNAKNIKLEIDSKDLMTLINSVLNSETLQSLASHIMRRNIPNESSMYNPYHPEDGVAETAGTTVEPKKRNRNASKNISKEKKIITEASLETDNENFIKGVGNKSKEILVVDSASPDEVKVISVQDLEKKNEKPTNSNQKLDDRYNFRKLQKRFELKDS